MLIFRGVLSTMDLRASTWFYFFPRRKPGLWAGEKHQPQKLGAPNVAVLQDQGA